MGNGNLQIDFAPPDLGPGVANLLTVLRRNKEDERAASADRRAEEMLKQNADRVKMEERRVSAEEWRRSRDWEQGQEDRRNKAFLSALEYDKRGDSATADSIRRMHGISSEAVMSEPSVFTAAQALAQAPKPEQGPVAFGTPSTQQQAPVTPLTALREHRTGTTVPEEQPTVAVPPPDIAVGQPAPNAASELEPMAIDPTTTGAKRFFGPSGQLIGEFDPAQERAFREDKAKRVSESLGPMGETYTTVAAMIARGDVSEAEGKALMSLMAAEAANKQKANEASAAREDKQAFDAAQADKFKRTFEQEKELARIRAATSGGGSGGNIDLSDKAKLADYAKANPGDVGGLARLADDLGMKGKSGDAAVKAAIDEVSKSSTLARAEKGVATRGSEKRIDFDNGISRINMMIDQIERAPQAWDEFVANKKAWLRSKSLKSIGIGNVNIGTIGSALGATDLDESQGLKSAEARTLFQRQSQLDTAIAKGFGGVITEGDRAAASENQANLSLNAQEKLRQLRELRAEKMRGFKVATGEDWTPEVSAPGAKGPRKTGGETAPSAEVRWVPIPPRLAAQPKYASKTEIAVDAAGKVLEAR